MPPQRSPAKRHGKLAPALSMGGLIVVSGPPLGGKGPLAARLEEMLPSTIKLAATDNLTSEQPVYFPKGVKSGRARDVEAELLREAERVWKGNGRVPALVIVCARFASADSRRKALRVAAANGMRFLLVEATSAPIRSLRRLSPALAPKEAVLRIERFERARKAHEPVSAEERTRLPAIALKRVLADLNLAARTVVGAWLGR